VYLLGAALVLLALGFVVTDLAVSDPVTEANCTRIRARIPAGITEAEVQALFGRPPDKKGRNDNGEPVGPFRVWTGRRGSIKVWLSEDSAPRVTYAWFRAAPAERFLDRLRGWLGW
jgi:hypothetical protein